jgi:biopolymer transport protein ExbB/TolQ
MFSIFTLLAATIVVHGFWVTVVRPNAQAVLVAQAAAMKADPNYVPQRSLWVIMKDYEQEACLILMLWAVGIIGFKGRSTHRERAALDEDLVQVPEGMRILPEDTREYMRQLEGLTAERQNMLTVRALRSALARFGATRNVQDVSEAAHSVLQAEAERLDSELSMIRYIAWAIPAIGFIGTVRGIGDALAEAHKAVTGDIAGVTAGLGVAFNSTFVALMLSLVLMFLLHNLQLAQERLVLDSETYLDQKLLRHLQVR